MKSAVRMSVLALSLAAAGAAHAQSSVTLYGAVDMGIGYNVEGGKSGASVNSGQMTTSFFGVKGSEDLGGGLKAIFDLESFFRADNGHTGRTDNEAFFSKQALVGLESATWGKLVAGKVFTPFAATMFVTNAFGGSSQFNPMFRQLFSGTSTVFGSFPGGLAGGSYASSANNDVIYDTAWNNAVMYTSPNFSGLTVSVIGAPGEVAGKGGRFNIGANVLYFNGPLTASAAFQKASLGISNEIAQPDGGAIAGATNVLATSPVGNGSILGDQTSVLLGGSYDLKFAKLFAQYAYVYNDITTPTKASQSDQLFTVGATVPFGPGYFSGDWGRDYKGGNTTLGLGKGHRDTISFAYNYPLSKRTDVYTAFRYDSWESTYTKDFHTSYVTAGIRHQF